MPNSLIARGGGLFETHHTHTNIPLEIFYNFYTFLGKDWYWCIMVNRRVISNERDDEE